jgi:hypothetical protein
MVQLSAVRDNFLFVQTSSGLHPWSYQMCTVDSFSGIKSFIILAIVRMSSGCLKQHNMH